MRIGTNISLSDSDGDGYLDAEEVARGSDPNLASHVPAVAEQTLSMVSYAENGIVFYCSVMYVKAGLETPQFGLGVVVDGIAFPLPPDLYSLFSTYDVQPGSNAGDTVHVLRTALPISVFAGHDSISMYSTATQPPADGQVGPSEMDATAATFVLAQGNVPMLARQSGGGIGIIYEPLVPSSELTGWQSGKICFTISEVSAVAGPLLIYDTGTSSCDIFDSMCDPTTCSSLVGSTVQIVDPAILAGG